MRRAAGWGGGAGFVGVLVVVVAMGLEVGAQVADSPPYFAPSAPANEAVFYLEPGKPFTGLRNVLLYDNNENGTAQGTILIDTVVYGNLQKVSVSRGVYEGATPGAEPICSGSGLGVTTTLKCKYFCREIPSPASVLPGCDMWPSTVRSLNAQDYSLSYYRDAAGVWTNRTYFNLSINNEQAWGSSINFTNPYRRVCVTIATASQTNDYILGNPPPAGTKRCWNLLYRVPARVASCRFDLALPRMPCRRDLFPDGSDQVVKVGVGQTLVANVYFDLLSSTDTMDIALLTDPGLPNGASIGPIRGGPSFNGAGVVSSVITSTPPDLVRYVFHRQVTFTPSERDAVSLSDIPEEGVTYPICFRPITYRNGSSPIYGAKWCSKIMVVRPEPQRSVSITCPSCAQPLTQNFTAMVRCMYTWNIILWERKDYDAAYPIDGLAPAGVAGQPAPLPVAGYYAGLYEARAELDPEYPLPPGAELMVPVQHAQCRDAPHTLPFTPCPDLTLQRKVYTQQLTWRPARGMENSEFQVCFRLSGARGISDDVVVPKRICSTVLVGKCRVCTLPGDTMESIAKEYRTDWLQLWGANVLVENPRSLAGYGSLHLGPTYVVSKEREAVQIVAGVFGMSHEGLVEMNPDLRGVTSLVKGTPVCIVPPVCRSSDAPEMTQL